MLARGRQPRETSYILPRFLSIEMSSSSATHEDARERFVRQLLDPSLLSRFFSSHDMPSFEISSIADNGTTANESSMDTNVVHDYLQLRREQNAGFAEKQLNDGTLALQRGDYKMAQQHFQQGLNMIPNHEALTLAMQQMHTKVKPAAASKSERNLRNAALENAFLAEVPTAVTSSDPKYPILNESGEEEEQSQSSLSSRRLRKRSKKRKKEKHKRKKKKKKKKQRKRHRSDSSSSSMSSMTDAHNSDHESSVSSRKRRRTKDNHNVDRVDAEDSNVHHDEVSPALEQEERIMQPREQNKRKFYEEEDSPGSLGTVDSMVITRKKQRS